MTNKEKLILFGAGGHCRSVLDCIDRNQFDDIVILDPDPSLWGTHLTNILIAGNDDMRINLFHQGFRHAFITVGGTKANRIREKIAFRLEAEGFAFPIIQSRNAIISTDSTIAPGVFIGNGAIINTGTEIGRFAIINTGSIIDHDCRIGEFCHVAPGVVMSGQVTIGAYSHIGTGSSIRQSVTIGMNTTIGVGSAVIKDIGDNCTAFGVPCKEKL